jgi:hypothetical protein
MGNFEMEGITRGIQGQMSKEIWTPERYRSYKPKKKAKYRSLPAEVDGHTFHSRKEAKRYGQLRIRQLAGEITDLELQPQYMIKIEGVKICDYFADFRYKVVATEQEVVEDVKSPATRKKEVYRLKKKMVEALFKIVIIES